MKKKKGLILVLVAVFLIIIFAAAVYYFQNRTVYTLEAPQAKGLESVRIKKNAAEEIILKNNDDMENILKVLGVERTTTKESKNGIPIIVDNIIVIDFNYSKDKKATVYVYEEGGKFFIEQPYNGIYKISQDDYEKIDSYASK